MVRNKQPVPLYPALCHVELQVKMCVIESCHGSESIVLNGAYLRGQMSLRKPVEILSRINTALLFDIANSTIIVDVSNLTFPFA